MRAGLRVRAVRDNHIKRAGNSSQSFPRIPTIPPARKARSCIHFASSYRLSSLPLPPPLLLLPLGAFHCCCRAWVSIPSDLSDARNIRARSREETRRRATIRRPRDRPGQHAVTPGFAIAFLHTGSVQVPLALDKNPIAYWPARVSSRRFLPPRQRKLPASGNTLFYLSLTTILCLVLTETISFSFPVSRSRSSRENGQRRVHG